MNKILKGKLRKDFNLFFNKGNVEISCGDGWYDLLYSLMTGIKMYCIYNKRDPISIVQIKEKFGTLSFYYDNGDDYIHGMVSMACRMSSKICEVCGTTIDVGRTSQYISFLCRECHKNHPRRFDLPWKPNKNDRLFKLIKIMDKIK